MKRSNPFSRYFLHNIGLKVVSLALAVLLWFTISSAPRTEIGFNVPIEFLNVPKDYEINTDSSPQAQVRLRGPERAIRRLLATDLHLVIDAKSIDSAASGERTFELMSAKLNLPSDIEVVQVIPSSVRLSFDKRVYRDLEVRARVSGNFPPGYKIASVVTEPLQVPVVGPEKRVNAIEAATTDPIDASGVMGKQVFISTPYVQDPLVRLARPTSVRVTVVTEKTK